MTGYTDDIKTTVRIAKAIDDDIREYRSFDVQVAYQKNRKRLEVVREHRPFTYYILQIAAILLLPLLVSTVTLSYLYIQQSKQFDVVSYLEASSARGFVTQVLLPDSSRIWLNSGSKLCYPSRFTDKERNVRLSGEGYFEVQSDKEHPFCVSLDNGIKVKTYGTKFNVKAYEGDRIIETTLRSGLLDVLFGTRIIPLKPNEQVSYDKNERRFMVSSVNINEKMAWKEGKLVFRNATLEEVLKELSRRYNVDIILHRESEKNYKFRATFSSGNITQILDYLRLAAPISWSFADMKQQQDYTYPRQRIDVWLK